MKKTILGILLFLTITSSIQSKEVPSAGAMMFDAVAIRPLGVVSVGLGATIWIVSMPFIFFTPSPGETLRQTSTRLVAYPIRFTFQRSMGDFPGYMEEIETVQE